MWEICLLYGSAEICVKQFKIKVTDPLCWSVTNLGLKYNTFTIANMEVTRIRAISIIQLLQIS